MISKEKTIRQLVKTAVDTYASVFEMRHIAEYEDPEGTINMKIHNVFIAALGSEIQYYTALVRSLDSSLGNMLEIIAMNIAGLFYTVSQSVEGTLENSRQSKGIYYLKDEKNKEYYIININNENDINRKKAYYLKKRLMEKYWILSNSIPDEVKIRTYISLVSNDFCDIRQGGKEVLKKYFTSSQLMKSESFWNFVCKSKKGYNIVRDEYNKHINKLYATYIVYHYNRLYMDAW
jgi:hypothetical protein